jgi:type IV secretion system protein VirB6
MMSRILINTRKSFAKLLIIFAVAFANPTLTHAMPTYDVIDWIGRGIGSIFGFFTHLSCDNISTVSSRYNIGNVAINVARPPSPGSQNDTWLFVSRVSNDRMFKIQWNTNGITTSPRKYIVLYRIDPRFLKPVTYILEYNHVTNQYVSDFHTFTGGDLDGYQGNTRNIPARYNQYDDYVNYRSDRSRIQVNDGDVVNITLKDANFVSTETAGHSHANLMTLLNQNDITKMTFNTQMDKAGVLWVNAARWCTYMSGNTNFGGGRDFCSSNLVGGVANGVGASANAYMNNLVGMVNSINDTSLNACANTDTGSDHIPCMYDKGRGMRINVGDTVIKPTFDQFFHARGTAAARNEVFVFYYKSRANGGLDFGTTIPISGQYSNYVQHMKDWSGTKYNSYTNMQNYLRSAAGQSDTLMNFIHAGSYIMFVQVGNADGPAGYHQHDNLRLSYVVHPLGRTPSSSVTGTAIGSQTFMANAPRNGNLYIKVNNPNSEVQGTLRVSYAAYGGHAGGVFLSTVLYDTIAGPVMRITRDTARLVFGGLANNPSWQLVVRGVLTLYIMIFGLSFLMGKVQITSMELVKRFAKLAVIFAVFQPGSWSFFHDNVFRMFLDGMSYLTYSITGVTSRVGNIFGFVDVIFDKYFDWKIWRAIFVNLLQIHNGMIIIALLMIDAILWYLMAVIDVVIAYILAFITMCVLISLAPIVVLCMLFERTKGIFDNWMSMFLNYMVLPTILLIFFLILDQLMTVQFNHVNMEVCWDWLIQFTIDIPIGDLFRVRFAIPFFPGIPFYLPGIEDRITCPFTNDPGELMNVVAAALMFKVYAQIGQGLIQYVTNIVARITNVMPARLRGAQQGATTPATAVSSHLGKPRRYVRDAMSTGIKEAYGGAKEGWKNPSKDGGGKGKRSGGSSGKGSGGDGGGSAPKMG